LGTDELVEAFSGVLIPVLAALVVVPVPWTPEKPVSDVGETALCGLLEGSWWLTLMALSVSAMLPLPVDDVGL